MAQVGMKRRWKEHVSASMRSTHENRNSKLYSSYHSGNCHADNMPATTESMGTFCQLEQVLGIGLKKTHLTNIISLFQWSDVEEIELNILMGSGSRNTTNQKKYRHLCYLFECAYALAIEPRRNISGNPSCEWQLRFYGR